MILRSLLLALPAAVALPLPSPAETSTPPKPNVIVIMVDDMGFADLGCYGSEIPTPNIDALAAGGVRFSQFYNTGKCCPTRASLLTGLYSHQAGIGAMVEDEGIPSYRGFLNDRCVTLADVMRSAGYFTAVSGKWHVGHKDKSMWPLQRGFDRFFGMPEGGGFYFKVKQGRTVALGNEEIYSPKNQVPEGWYTTDAIHKHGIQFIDEALDAKKPFFLYLAHNAPHYPLQAPAEEIAKFRGKYRAGWDELRARRYQRQLEMGIIKPEWKLSGRPEGVDAWDRLTEKQRDQFDEQMAIYAAMIAHVDGTIGDLTQHLKDRSALDNTLILFLSDNGASSEGGVYGKLSGNPPGSADSQVYAGQAWATLQNTPFRRYKSQSHEGGISAPLIAHWPQGISAEGELRPQPAHVIDIMPTVVELTGATYPTTVADKAIQPMEGRSLVPAFRNETTPGGPLFWEHSGNTAVRDGDWKLIRFGRGGEWELYDLKADRTELHDLHTTNPEKAETLRLLWKDWARRVGVKPFVPEAAPGFEKKKRARGKGE